MSSPKPSPARAGYGELALIERIRLRTGVATGRALRVGIGDDCAVLRPPRGHEVLVTTDLCLEGRHFRRDWHPAASAGHRALARGLSDLAAMGARPLACFLSIALPKAVAKTRWLDGFLDGLLALAGAHGCPLAGGDTSESPTSAVLVDITLVGSVPAGRALLRSGARPGDLIYCTGTLGGAAEELRRLQERPRVFRRASAKDLHPHLYPQPRLATGQALLRRGLATACIDLSDGLSTDLAHLCGASGLAAEIDAAALPVHAGADRAQALHGGEDYELLFTASPAVKMPRRLGGVALTRIGRVAGVRKGRPQVVLIDKDLRTALPSGGWEHLR